LRDEKEMLVLVGRGCSVTPHTLVVGGGVSGLSVALALLQRGQRVTVLERGQAGGESSWAGGGILSPLLPWEYAEPVTALASRSMAAYAGWVAEIETASGLDAEFWRCGMLALEVAAPQQALAWCAAHGMAAERGSPARLNPLSPTLPRGGGSNSVWLPGVAQVRNPRLVAAMRAAVAQLGGVIREHCPATGVLAQGTRVTSVQTAAEPFAVDSVVLATGAWSGLGLAGLAAGLATLGCVAEALLGVERLLRGSEGEGLPAIGAGDGLILVHERTNLRDLLLARDVRSDTGSRERS
jgi:glycine oxidase